MMYTTSPATAAAAAALAAPEPQPGTGSDGKPGNCAKQLFDQTVAARMTETVVGDRAFIGVFALYRDRGSAGKIIFCVVGKNVCGSINLKNDVFQLARFFGFC
jgi:hypothetical protein